MLDDKGGAIRNERQKNGLSKGWQGWWRLGWKKDEKENEKEDG